MRQDTLSRQIAADVLKKQRPMDLNRAAFLALRDEICAAMEDGWPVKRIWETLRDQGQISFSYPAFTGYVNRLILRVKQDSKTHSSEPVKPPKAAPLKPSTIPAGKRDKPPESEPRPDKPSTELKGFHHDPTAFSKEDILG